jgi:mevalonate pyrophosphate decarboxylase
LDDEYYTGSSSSSVIVSDDRSTTSSKTIHPLNVIKSFLLQMRVSSPVSKDLAYMASLFLEKDYPGKVIMW